MVRTDYALQRAMVVTVTWAFGPCLQTRTSRRVGEMLAMGDGESAESARREFHPRGELQLAQNRSDLIANGVERTAHARGDFCVGQARFDIADELLLSRRQVRARWIELSRRWGGSDHEREDRSHL